MMSYFKTYYIVNKKDYIDYCLIREPYVKIIKYIEIEPKFMDFINTSNPKDELVILIRNKDMKEFLDKLFCMNDVYNQFLVDGLRSHIHYDNSIWNNESDIKSLFDIISGLYSKKIANQIICLCTQGSLAFIMCKLQTILHKYNLNLYICELTNQDKYTRKMSINLKFSKKMVKIEISKILEIKILSKKNIETRIIFKLIVEYSIFMLNNIINAIVYIEIL